jgi:hypothetical protein
LNLIAINGDGSTNPWKFDKKSLRDLDAEREIQEAAKRRFEMGKRERDGKAL